METRANFVLIGAFVFLAMGALVLFSVWISKAQFNQDYSVYDVVFDGPVNGLTEGGEVRFNGIKVGELTQLGLDEADPSDVIARIRVDSKTPVRMDSRAVLGFQGITGVTYIQISAGSTSEPLLPAGTPQNPARIPTEKTQLEELFDGGQDVLASSTDTLRRLNTVLSDENIRHFSNILENLDQISEQAAKDGALIADMRRAIKSMDDAGNNVNTAAISIDEAARNFDERFALVANDAVTFLGAADGAVQSADIAFADVAGAVNDLAGTLGPGAEDVLNEFANAARELRILVTRLDSVVQDVERDPREFVLGDNKPFE
ncbi:MAG: MCE family protein [Hirschia sp.]|nr:MCE family protein [Hirschia sp.]MBF17456.1 MCE family protein [Hirschia sp.]